MDRRGSWLGPAAGLALAALALAASAPAQARCPIPGVPLGCTAPPPAHAPDPGGDESPDQPVPAPGASFGFNLGYRPPGDATPRRSLEALAATGARLLRYPVAWRGFEDSTADEVVTREMRTRPQDLPADSGLRRLDERYADLTADGITPVVVLGDVPLWAGRQHRCLRAAYAALHPRRCPARWRRRRQFPAPEFFAQWREFVAWAAARWPRARIEGPNEPDRDSPAAPPPAAAAAIQCELYRAAAGAGPVLSMAVTEPDYVRDFVPAARGCYDVYSFHPYPGATELGAGSELARRFAALREARTAAADGTPIWVTETGYSFVPGSDEERNRRWESVYADATRRLYNRLATMADVDAVLLHTLRDRPIGAHSDRDDPEYHFGLFQEDWRPKPRACHFVAAAGGAGPGCPTASG